MSRTRTSHLRSTWHDAVCSTFSTSSSPVYSSTPSHSSASSCPSSPVRRSTSRSPSSSHWSCSCWLLARRCPRHLTSSQCSVGGLAVYGVALIPRPLDPVTVMNSAHVSTQSNWTECQQNQKTWKTRIIPQQMSSFPISLFCLYLAIYRVAYVAASNCISVRPWHLYNIRLARKLLVTI